MPALNEAVRRLKDSLKAVSGAGWRASGAPSNALR